MIHKSWDINEHATGRFKNGKPIMGATFQNGLNDIEPDGSFVPCDMGIEEVTEGVTHLRTKRGRWGQLRFGDSAHSNSFLVKIKNKDMKGVSFKYTGAVGSSMTANNVKPLCLFDNGISIESTPYYKGVKMDILVQDPLTAPIEYPFSVKTYGQKYTVVEEDGGLTFVGNEDAEPIFIKPPYAVDANGDIGTVTIQDTGMEGSLHTFKKVVDESWLRQAAAPVRIDPDVTIFDGTQVGGVVQEAYMVDSSPTINFGDTAQLRIGLSGGDDIHNGIIWANLAGFEDISEVITAHFGGNLFFFIAPSTFTWYEVLLNWIETEVTWNDRVSGTAWNDGGCTGSGTDRNAVADGSKAVTGVDSDFQIPISTDLALKMATDTNNGIVVEGSATYAFFRQDSMYFYMEYTEDLGIAIFRRRMEGY